MINTAFSLLDKQFTLSRYPEKHQHKSLQAWDSADELLIEYIEENGLLEGNQNLCILNDDFGALGCWFASYPTLWLSDSYIARRSLELNLAQNNLTKTALDINDSLYQPSQVPDVVLLKIPRTLALLEYQLIRLKQNLKPHTQVIAAGKVKVVTNGVLALFEKYLGETKTSLAKKKSRLIFCKVHADRPLPASAASTLTKWNTTLPNGKTITLNNHANVFSRQSLDIGARAMLPHMQVSPEESVVDLGCGNGILGLNVLNLAPQASVTFVDESYMAVQSARENVTGNFPNHIGQCEFVASNCLESLLEQSPRPVVSKIFCNPPFHQQNTITDHIAWQMFNDSKELLVKGGHLIVVGNRHLDYHVKLKRIFGGVKLLASDKKFVILSAAKR